jgi:predicted metal-dependent hydrolase
MPKYRVAYSATGWQPRTYHRGCRAPRQQTTDAFQVVQQTLPDGERLYVELVRAPHGQPRILVARLDRPTVRAGQVRYQVARFLHAEDLDLIEVTPGDKA